MRKILITGILGLFSLYSYSQYACSDFKRSVAPSAGVPNLDYSVLSDTFDILHTHLDIDLGSLSSNQWSAKADLWVVKLQNTNRFLFELDGFNVDSAFVNGVAVNTPPRNILSPFNELTNLPTWNLLDTAFLEIFYSGNAPADPSGWGGWHRSNPYHFNLGVGFGVNPHSYGRSMFPAFDNFIEHSTYSFHVSTPPGYMAYTNGIRTSFSVDPSTLNISQNWECSDPMPSYLVSLAIAPYAEIQDSILKSDGTYIPSLILARPADTSNAKQSFAHLQGIFSSYEKWFGPYVWDKVGYALTTVGAMEHATSIHLPVQLVDGTFQGEDIIAHELAHHWWGNLITCRTANDMWINEGMAEFSSHLYEEDVYNRTRYMRTVRGNQLYVLNNARKNDGGYIALNGVDHSTTYGTHVYQKGAWVGHNLRGYMGDSTFQYTVHNLLANHAFSNLNTSEFENELSTISGINMTNFFADWVTQPGNVAVSIDSIRSVSTGSSWDVEVGISQHKKERSTYLTSAPLELKLYGANGETYSTTTILISPNKIHSVIGLPFQPLYATINEGEAYLASSTFDRADGIGFGIFNMDPAKGRLQVKTATDSHYVYIAHHWAGPESQSTTANLSKSRFWTIRGTWGTDFDAEFRLFYDGRVENGGQDDDLVSMTEDSLVVMYRFDASHDWELFPHFNKNVMGNATDKYGQITLTKILPGDYVLANASPDIGFQESDSRRSLFKIYPNPSNGSLRIELLSDSDQHAPLIVVDAGSGKIVHSEKLQLIQGWNVVSVILDVPAGSYWVKTKMGEQLVLTH